MIQSRIDGGNFKSSYNKFSVGFPDVGIDSDEISKQLKQSVKDEQKKILYATLKLTREDKRNEELFEGLILKCSLDPTAGELHLSCMFGNGDQSRCNIMLSKTPKKQIMVPPKIGVDQTWLSTRV